MFDSNKTYVQMLLFYDTISYIDIATSKVLMDKKKKKTQTKTE